MWKKRIRHLEGGLPLLGNNTIAEGVGSFERHCNCLLLLLLMLLKKKRQKKLEGNKTRRE